VNSNAFPISFPPFLLHVHLVEDAFHLVAEAFVDCPMLSTSRASTPAMRFSTSLFCSAYAILAHAVPTKAPAAVPAKSAPAQTAAIVSISM
jgi:hypothetical protein